MNLRNVQVLQDVPVTSTPRNPDPELAVNLRRLVDESRVPSARSLAVVAQVYRAVCVPLSNDRCDNSLLAFVGKQHRRRELHGLPRRRV